MQRALVVAVETRRLHDVRSSRSSPSSKPSRKRPARAMLDRIVQRRDARRSGDAGRQRQGAGDRRSAPSELDADAAARAQRSAPAPAQESREDRAAADRRSHDADSRRLRAARAQPRRQAAGRTRAAALPSIESDRRRRRSLAVGRRHRHARPGRNETRSRPPPHRRAHQRRSTGCSPTFAGSARCGARRRIASRSSRSSATPTSASRRCSTRWRAATRTSPISRSRRSIRPFGAPISRPARTCASPIPSASSPIFRKDLVNAFRATLEELREADLLLHVLDASNPQWPRQRRAVEAILHELELDRTPRLLVFNKCDRAVGDLPENPARSASARTPGKASIRCAPHWSNASHDRTNRMLAAARCARCSSLTGCARDSRRCVRRVGTAASALGRASVDEGAARKQERSVRRSLCHRIRRRLGRLGQRRVDGAARDRRRVGPPSHRSATAGGRRRSVVASNDDLDLALLRTPRRNLPVVALGSSSHLPSDVGREVGLLGYPIPDEFDDEGLGLATSLEYRAALVDTQRRARSDALDRARRKRRARSSSPTPAKSSALPSRVSTRNAASASRCRSTTSRSFFTATDRATGFEPVLSRGGDTMMIDRSPIHCSGGISKKRASE